MDLMMDRKEASEFLWEVGDKLSLFNEDVATKLKHISNIIYIEEKGIHAWGIPEELYDDFCEHFHGDGKLPKCASRYMFEPSFFEATFDGEEDDEEEFEEDDDYDEY